MQFAPNDSFYLTDPSFGLGQWGIRKAHVDQVWDSVRGSASIIVSVPLDEIQVLLLAERGQAKFLVRDAAAVFGLGVGGNPDQCGCTEANTWVRHS